MVSVGEMLESGGDKKRMVSKLGSAGVPLGLPRVRASKLPT